VRLTPESKALLEKLVEEHMEELAPKCEPLIESLRNLQQIWKMEASGGI
jgi:hypothetical protein